MQIVLLLCAVVAHSQENRTEVCIDFRVNSAVIDPTYAGNAIRIQEIIDFLQTIRQDSTTQILEISFTGAASPEGSDRINRKLARGRLAALEKIVRREVDIPDSVITHNDSYIPWHFLKSQIQDSDLAHKDEVIAILNEEARLVDHHLPSQQVDNRIVKLKQLDNGKVWQQMNKLFFARMRNACAVFVTFKKELPPEPEPVIVPDTVIVEPEPVVEVVEVAPDTTVVVETIIPEVEEWSRKLYIKTNLVGLGLGIANIGAEIDLAKHWSFALPIYYSAWNYFKNTVKFRTFSVQPEVRYWLDEDNCGLFAGAHFGLAYFNFAFDGDYRYQDHNGTSPAWGGGLSVGYRLPLSKNRKWHIEFAIGAGVYDEHYDTFLNKTNGRKTETLHNTYIGIDQAAVNFSYRFDMKKGR